MEFFSGRHFSPSLSISQLSIFLSRVETWLSPLLCLVVIIAQILFKQPCWWYFMTITSLTSLGDTISQQTFGSFDSFWGCNIYLTKGIQDIFQKIIKIMEMNEEMFYLVQLAFLHWLYHIHDCKFTWKVQGNSVLVI